MAPSETSTEGNATNQNWISYMSEQLYSGIIEAWESDRPKFGSFFEQFLFLFSCGILWLCSPAYFVLLCRDRYHALPWTYVTYFKLLVFMMLSGTTILEFTSEVSLALNGLQQPLSDFVMPVVLLTTYSLEFFMLTASRSRGCRSSALLWFFWLSMAVCGLPKLCTVVLGAISKEVTTENVTVYVIQYVGMVLQFIISCFADNPPLSEAEDLHPSQKASFINQISFHWCSNLVLKGWKKPLVIDNLWQLPRNCSSRYCLGLWNHACESFNTGTSINKNERLHCQEDKLPTLWIIVRAYFWPFMYANMLYLLSKVFVLFMPQMLSLLIDFASNKNEPTWHGFVYCGVLLLVSMLTTVIKNLFYYKDQIIMLQLKTSLMAAVYRKAMRLSTSARTRYTIGEITNLMSLDSQRVSDTVFFLNHVWGGPMIISIVLYLLWQILGPPVLAGVGILVLLVPVNSVIANKIKVFLLRKMKLQDKRIKMLTEIISGIKVLKLYAWEVAFEKRVELVRKEEIMSLVGRPTLEAAVSFIWLTTPYLVALSTFTTYLLVSDKNILDAQTVFVSISLYNIMQSPLQQLPSVLAQCIQAKVSLERLDNFFHASEVDCLAVQKDDSTTYAVAVKGGNFMWDSGDCLDGWQLKSIDLEIGYGQLVAVVGPVGAGKSSLISALLGDINKRSGSVIMNGKVSYIPQQPWLWSGSAKENIVWGSEPTKNWYTSVVMACALSEDFDTFVAGDQTEIGDKGVNLSGGQRQRVCIARAVACDADIILLDDSLSAVDSSVSRQIFKNVIGPQGLLKEKTRLFVTHSLSLLQEVDMIVVMQDGCIVEKGTYMQLLGDEFSHYLIQNGSVSFSVGTEVSGQTHRALRAPPSHQEGQDKIGSEVRKEDTLDIVKGGHSSFITPKRSQSDFNLGKTITQIEDVNIGKVKWDVYLYYASSVGLVLSLIPPVVFSVAQAFQVGGNIWLSKWSDNNSMNVGTNKLGSSRMGFLIGYSMFGLGQAVLYYIGSLSIWLGCLRAGMHLHHKLLTSVLHLPMLFFDSNPVGRIMNRFNADIGALDTQLPSTISSSIACLTQVFATLLVIIGSNPIVAAVVIPIMMFYYSIHSVYIPTSRQLRRLQSVAKSPVFSHVIESLQGVVTIRAFGKVNVMQEELHKKQDNANRTSLANVACDRWLEFRLEFIGNMITFAAALFSVAMRDSLSPGIVGLSITYALNVTVTLNWLVRMSSAVAANIVCVERIKQYVDEPTESTFQSVEHHSASPWWPQCGFVAFKGYSTCYRPGLSDVLHDISFSVSPGEKVGIVGRTGAGKSSLTMALFRILEGNEGSIEIDGVNIATMSLHDLRSRLTVIPQEPVLFGGNLRVNLDPSNIYREEELWRALDLSHLGSFVRTMPNRLDTVVDENGSNLSIGQKQLVCLARALLRKSKILVLDEATAAVDLETDNLIQATIRSQFKDCTVLTVAHRLNTIMDCDRVMVLDQGQIAEFDSPSALLKSVDSLFYKMVKDAGMI
ncbi:LOW QUALITY PROTEIN: multidrug resistance-associated protein 1-like [Macrobrachium nipponense]|uniref:LOW QUALITY PROTEIN: multidrug resistance-associated protein 1-like n=1 Tax=Macrobrachium nipponense TaxID=159736 RepID=UPI0030C88CB8